MCLEHIFPIFVCLSSVGYIHVFLKSLPHPNELYCMHLTLETPVLEDHPKKPKILKLKPMKTEITTNIRSHKLFGWQEG